MILIFSGQIPCTRIIFAFFNESNHSDQFVVLTRLDCSYEISVIIIEISEISGIITKPIV